MTSTTTDTENQHDAEEAAVGRVKPRYDDVNTPVILMVGAISTIVTICTIFFVQGLCYQWHNSYIRERSTDFVNEPVRSIVEGQKAMLADDSEKGVKPVSETMKDVVAQLGKKAE